jgi:hypothetical protein
MSTWQDELRDVKPSLKVIAAHQLHQDGVRDLAAPDCHACRVLATSLRTGRKPVCLDCGLRLTLLTLPSTSYFVPHSARMSIL